jgi:hypothetical protein
MAAEAKPCPFDGKAAVVSEIHDRYPAEGEHPAGSYVAAYTIRCDTCGIEMSDEYEDEVLERWNTRPVIETPEEEEQE